MNNTNNFSINEESGLISFAICCNELKRITGLSKEQRYFIVDCLFNEVGDKLSAMKKNDHNEFMKKIEYYINAFSFIMKILDEGMGYREESDNVFNFIMKYKKEKKLIDIIDECVKCSM